MKIYIIDEVHMLSQAAFNAFLKTLEEPPPHTVFIMATTEQNKVPETVLSRCQCFEFKAISDTQISERLREIAQSEKMGITDGALRMIARRAEGSMRDAQSLLDQAAAYAGETIDEETLGMVLGLVSREKIWGILRPVAKRDVDAALQQLHDLYYAGFDVGVLIRELFEAVRSLTVVKVSKSPETILNEPPDSLAAMKEMAKDVSAGRLQQFYDLLLRAKSQASLAGNPLSVLEMVLIKMARLEDVIPVGEILERLKGYSPQEPARQSPPPPSQGHPHTPPPKGFATVPTVISSAPRESGEPWVMIRTAIAEKRPMLGVALEQIVDFTIQGEKAILSYPEDQTLLKAQCEESRELIEKEIEKNMGRRFVFLLAPAQNSPKIAQVKRTALDQKLRNEMLNDPTIQKAVDMFDGRPAIDEESGK